MRSSVLVLVLLSAIAISDACASKGFFEGLARLRVQTLLSLYPNLAEEIRNGQLAPNSNFNNRNGFNNNNNNNRNPFNGNTDNQGTQPRNQGGLQNQQLPLNNNNNQGLPNGNGNGNANGLLNGNGGGSSSGNLPNGGGNVPNGNANLLN